MTMETGLWLTHKRRGATSFATVRAFADEATRGDGKRPAICHGGTLDPFAEGLLLVLVGPATQLMDLQHAAPKRYVAEIAWGSETNNGDPHGEVIARGDPSSLTSDRLEAALAPFLGWTLQVPPALSAKKIAGEPAYRRVERGEHVELPPSRVYLHEARWLEHRLPDRSTLELLCRGGYYVRALARDLGRALGTYAHLSALARPQIGPWRDPPDGERRWIPSHELLPWYPSRTLDDHEVGALRAATSIPRGELAPPEWTFPPGFPEPPPKIRALHQGKLIGLLREERDGRLAANPLLRGRW